MSTLNVDTIVDAAGTGPATFTSQEAAKMRVSYTTVTTTSAHDSFNVTSLTDNGTGDTTVNFTNSFAAANDPTYSINVRVAARVTQAKGQATGSVDTTIYTAGSSQALEDRDADATAIGDLA